MRFGKNAAVIAGCSAMFASCLANMLLFQTSRAASVSVADAKPQAVGVQTLQTHDLARLQRIGPEPRGPKARLQAIQRELQRIGYAPGNLQGLKDMQTQAAIVAFEYDHGLPLKAEPSSELLQALVMGLPRNPGISPAGVSPAAHQLIQTVQASLTKLGFDVGGIDGRLGPQTRRAIMAFEERRGLQRTGRVSARLLNSLASSQVTERMSMVQR